MGFQANVLRLVIASPGDVTDARKVVTEEIYRWNDANSVARKVVLLPVKWETHSTPQMGDHPQTIINRQLLDDADLLIGIFGTRIGSPTDQYVSGTVEEIKRHVAAGKTAKVYFSDVPVSPSKLDTAQHEALRKFREECQRTGLYATFGTIEQFRTDFSHHLALELNQARYLWLPAPEEVSAQPSTTSSLDPDAIRLLKAASRTDGTVILTETLGGVFVSAGGQELLKAGDNRSAAKWRQSSDGLQKKHILEMRSEGVYLLNCGGVRHRRQGNCIRADRGFRRRLPGPPDHQVLNIRASRNVELTQLDFLTSSEACVATQEFSEAEGLVIEIDLQRNAVAKLFQAPRPDIEAYDLSGPAKLRLSLRLDDRSQTVILPVLLKPQIVINTQWIVLTGSAKFDLPSQG